jgi:hypothetical protein
MPMPSRGVSMAPCSGPRRTPCAPPAMPSRSRTSSLRTAYAPLFINVSPGGSQWTPDLIGFDALHSYGGVSYYVLKLFGNNHGSEIVTAESPNMPTREVPMRGPGISSTDPRMRTVPRFYYDAGHRDGQDLREGRQSDARSVAGSFEDFRRVECRADGSDWRGEGKRSFGPEHYH